ncbi:MAG: TIGR03757 family integrating conjugative element protein [Pseudomonadota bacterium]|nr:TIGR03757 family integrating conjugative element protein [Pseudomonadota bacterium]
MSLSLGDAAWAAREERKLVRIEVFTSQDLPIQSLKRGDPSASTKTEVYEVDGIDSLDAMLSKQLPPDPQAAKRLAQERSGQLKASRVDAARQAAIGLLKAAEYGIDRYPAIVLDGQAVVYGVTDVGEALRHYRMWQGRAPH